MTHSLLDVALMGKSMEPKKRRSRIPEHLRKPKRTRFALPASDIKRLHQKSKIYGQLKPELRRLAEKHGVSMSTVRAAFVDNVISND